VNIFKDLSPHKQSGPYTKQRYCSHLAKSHGSHIRVVDRTRLIINTQRARSPMV